MSKMDMAAAYERKDRKEAEYRSQLAKKTLNQLRKEDEKWRKYMDKYNAAYNLHGGVMTPPDCLSDGDKVSILREIIREKEAEQ